MMNPNILNQNPLMFFDRAVNAQRSQLLTVMADAVSECRTAADQAAELNETGQVGLLRLAEVFRSVHRWYTAELLTRPRTICSRLPRMAVSWAWTRESSTRCCRMNLAQRSISAWTTSCRSGGMAKLTS